MDNSIYNVSNKNMISNNTVSVTQRHNVNGKNTLKKVDIPDNGCLLGAHIKNANLARYQYIPMPGDFWYEKAFNPFLTPVKNVTYSVGTYLSQIWKGIKTGVPQTWGAGVDDFESLVGKKLGVQLGFQQWFNEGEWKWEAFPGSFCNDAYGQGAKPMITWELTFFPGRDYNKFILDQILDALRTKKGPLYEYMHKWAVDARNYGRPVFLRPFHEMNSFWYTWSGICNGGKNGGPEKYVQVFREMHKLFEEAGARNVTFVWCANGHTRPARSLAWNIVQKYYPGNDTVDWIGFDGYKERGGASTAFNDAFVHALSYFDVKRSAELRKYFASDRDFAEFLSKPRGIYEYSAGPESDKPEFISYLHSKAKEYNLKLINYFNIDKENNWSLTAPLSGLDPADNRRYLGSINAYASSVTNSYFIGQKVTRKIDLSKVKREAENTEDLQAISDILSAAETVSKRMAYFKTHIRSTEYDDEEKIKFVQAYQVLINNLLASSKILSGGVTAGLFSKYEKNKQYMGVIQKALDALNSVLAYIKGDDMKWCVSLSDIKDKTKLLELQRSIITKALKMLTSASMSPGNPYRLRALDLLSRFYFSVVEEEQIKGNDLFNFQAASMRLNEMLKKENVHQADADKLRTLYDDGMISKADKDFVETYLFKFSPQFSKDLYLIYGGSAKGPNGEYFKDFTLEGLDSGRKQNIYNKDAWFNSPTYSVCSAIIKLANNKEYCEKSEIKDVEKYGIIASAKELQARVILANYHDTPGLTAPMTEDYVEERREFLGLIKRYIIESKSYIAAKEKEDDKIKLFWGLSMAKDLVIKEGKHLVERLDLKKENNFFLNKQIEFDAAQIDAELKNVKPVDEIINDLNTLVNDKRLDKAFRDRVKAKIAELLLSKKDPDSFSRAMGIYAELGDRDTLKKYLGE